jgi:hypothetical protein
MKRDEKAEALADLKLGIARIEAAAPKFATATLEEMIDLVHDMNGALSVVLLNAEYLRRAGASSP